MKTYSKSKSLTSGVVSYSKKNWAGAFRSIFNILLGFEIGEVVIEL